MKELPGTKEKLQQICKNKNVPTRCTESKVIKGWSAKQKGAHQILFERGWIDPSKITKYTENRKNTERDSDVGNDDVTGCKFSLKELMKKQRDFVEETTLLQYYGIKMGVVVDRTPKCHPELAGEGIEYVWAVAKLHYRKAPISEKRTKANFKKLVEESTSTHVLSLDKIRACSRKARSYMKLYKVMEDTEMNDEALKGVKHSIMEDTMKLYSKMKKK